MPRKFLHSWLQAHLLQSISMSSSLRKINPTSNPSQAAWKTNLQALHRKKIIKHTVLIIVLILYYYLKNVMHINVYNYTLKYLGNGNS